MLLVDLVPCFNGGLGAFEDAFVDEHGSQGANPREDEVDPRPVSRAVSDWTLEGLHRDNTEGNCEVLRWSAHISTVAKSDQNGDHVAWSYNTSRNCGVVWQLSRGFCLSQIHEHKDEATNDDLGHCLVPWAPHINSQLRLSAENVVSKQSTAEAATNLEDHVGETNPPVEAASIFAEHEGECYTWIVMGAGDTSGEDKKDKEPNKEAHVVQLWDGWLVEGCEQECSDHLEDEDHNGLNDRCDKFMACHTPIFYYNIFWI